MADSASTARGVALVTAIGLAIIAVFQVALALGVPWGRAAYGGTSETLPPELRVASAVAAIVWLLAAAVVLGRGGYWGSPRRSAAFRWGTWLVAGLLGSAPSSISRHPARGSASAGVRWPCCWPSGASSSPGRGPPRRAGDPQP